MASVRRAPAVQAAYMKNLIAELGARGHAAALTERAAELLVELEQAARASWLPVRCNVGVVEALCAHLGEDAGLELLAECVYAQFETPLWSNFVGPAVRLLGRNPGSLGRWIPRGLQIVFRDCGVWTAERTGDGELAVHVEELPEELATHRLWLRSLGIGMRPVFLVCGVDGTSDLVSADTASRCADYRLSWKPDAEEAARVG